MTSRELWLKGEVTIAEERDLFDQGLISECDYEFGPHEDVHDDAVCGRTLEGMRADDQADWFADAYNRDMEEQTLGRPLFPNEY